MKISFAYNEDLVKELLSIQTNLANQDLVSINAKTRVKILEDGKINRIDKVLPIIERSAQYDFDESVRRCQSGQCKRENIGDVGQDTFTIMANRKGNSKDKETKIVKNKSSRSKNKKKNTYSDQ